MEPNQLIQDAVRLAKCDPRGGNPEAGGGATGGRKRAAREYEYHAENARGSRGDAGPGG